MSEAAGSVARHQHVNQLIVVQVPAFDQGGAGAEFEERSSRALHRGLVVHREAGQQCGFVDVRRDQCREWEQMIAQRGFSVGRKQAMPRRRHHDRVDDERRPAVPGNTSSDSADQRSIGQHASLERVRWQVLSEGVELRFHEVRRNWIDGVDAQGILCGECHDDTRAMYAELVKCLEIGLDTGATARIRASYREGDAHARFAPKHHS